MKQKLWNAISLALIFSMLFTSAALADDVTNNLDLDVDATLEATSLAVGGPNKVVDLYTVNRNGDGKNGCNLTGGTTLVVDVSSSNAGVVSVSPSQITFTSCEGVLTNLGTAVTVTPLSAGTTTISLSEVSNTTGGTFNLAPASFTVNVNPPLNIATTTTVSSAFATYADSSVTLSATVAPNPGGGSVSFTVNGSPAGSGSVGAGGVASVSFDPSALSAGSYTVQASFGGFGTFLTSNGSGTLSIGKAATTTTVSCGAGPFPYTGTPYTPCSALVTGPNGLSANLTVSYSDNTNAGTVTASASYGETTNYLASNDTEDFTIGKATTVTTVTCAAGPFTFNGAAQTPCTALVTGPNGLSEELTVNYSNNTNAGQATAAASYTESANYLSSTDTENFTIGKATTVTTVTCAAGPFTYNGAAHTPCSATVTGVGGLSESVTVNYTDNVDAGTASATATYAESGNYLSSSDTETFTINKASTTTTVTCAAGPFTYNGAAHTPCSAKVIGAGGLDETLTVTYANNVNAGTASASASYAESANHLASNGSETFTIEKAPTTTTVTCGSGPFIYNGTAQEPCSAKVTGAGGLDETLTVTYANNVNAGTASASASYAESANHLSSSDSKNFTIEQAPVTATAGSGSSTYDGAAHSPSACAVTGDYTGDLTCTNSPALVGPNAGTTTIAPVVSGTGLSNFAITLANGSYTINKANASCTVTGYTVVFDNLAHTATGSCVGVLDETLAGLDLTGTTHTLVGIYNDPWTFTDVTGNYNNTSGGVTDTINAWTFNGFFQPVDMNGIWNTVKNGSTVPLKFELFAGSTELTATSSVKSITTAVVACTAGDEDAIETLATATGGTALRYDATSGQFIFNWKTPSTANKCYRVTMEALDGSKIIALFKLK